MAGEDDLIMGAWNGLTDDLVRPTSIYKYDG